MAYKIFILLKRHTLCLSFIFNKYDKQYENNSNRSSRSSAPEYWVLGTQQYDGSFIPPNAKVKNIDVTTKCKTYFLG